MEIRQLRYFVAVAERLSFTAAARHLKMAQPPLSIQIRKLEQEFGGALFRRLGRRVDLTPAGQTLLDEAREILARTDLATVRLQDQIAGRLGEMTVGYTDAAFSAEVTRRFRKFGRKHRGLRLVFRPMGGNIEGSLDGHIAVFSRGELPPEAIPIEDSTPQVAVPPKHRLAEKPEFLPSDLIGESILSAPFELRSAAERLLAAHLESAGITCEWVASPGPLQDRLWRVSLGTGLCFCTSADRGALDAHRIPLANAERQLVTAFVPNPAARSDALPALIAAIRE